MICCGENVTQERKTNKLKKSAQMKMLKPQVGKQTTQILHKKIK